MAAPLAGRLPTESPEYAKLRDELQQAEVALRDQRERVAELRRKLPLEVEIPDHAFEALRDSQRTAVSLGALFADPAKPLVVMHFMFGKQQEAACPMCSLWADGYDGLVPHLERNVNFAVLVAGDIARFEGYGRQRGWRNLRLVSAAASTLKRDLGFESEDGAQLPGVSVFYKQGERILHFYSQAALLGPDGFRGMDLLCPAWHYLDLTKQGRADWMPGLRYD